MTALSTAPSTGPSSSPAAGPSSSPAAGPSSSPAAGPRLPGLVRHSAALAVRSLLTTLRTPEALIDVTLQPVVFLLLFTYVFGGALGHGSRHDYLQYLLPGLLGQSIALAGIAIGQNLNTDIQKGVFDRLRSLPIGRSVPLVGAVAADVVRYLVVCTVILGFGSLIGFRVQTGVLALLAAVLLSVGFALCFCWVSVWVGLTVRTPGAVQGAMFLLVLPLSFASGTFVSVTTLPGPLQAFVHVNPITQLVTTVRGLVLGGPVAASLGWTLLWMAGLLAVFVPLALRAYGRRV